MRDIWGGQTVLRTSFSEDAGFDRDNNAMIGTVQPRDHLR